MKNLQQPSHKKPLLSIDNLTVKSVSVSHQQFQKSSFSNNDGKQNSFDKVILENLNLNIYPGETHVIMGPNGAGKSTLAKVLARHSDYEIITGNIIYLDQKMNEFTPYDCAIKGIFLSFQHPISIPGVSNIQFLKSSLNSIRRSQQKKPLDAMEFSSLAKEKMKKLQIPEEFLYRSVNEDFSGGEKKRNEILQMLLLDPKLIILDEIDSGLDIDALKIIANGIQEIKNQNNSILLITHYNRILNYIKPDFVHILAHKKIILSGGMDLAEKLESHGYGFLIESFNTNNNQ